MAGRDRELLIPVASEALGLNGGSDVAGPTPVSPAIVAPPYHAMTLEGSSKYIRSWVWKKFMSGCVILCPIAITFYTTWWFISFFDGFFSPIYAHLGINLFGIGFVTSITFIFLVGVFTSSYLGASLLGLGEWFIKKMPLISSLYSASKQISAAISPDQTSRAFKEVVIVRHPRIGEYAFGFITSTIILRTRNGEEELYSVYLPTNHLYLGDIFLMSSNDVIRPDLTVREAIEIVLSGGMSIPQIISTMDCGIPVLRDHAKINKS
ncbi:Protein LIKE COV 3 [Carex littledalei]|uniref:Protein LIKE COV 3 n=1 Tax=Carex littledalei TaxID=544730 RepID=A0A833QJN5_9POAL|nr:Protein LIKE COV 3 [Carex littledalei]